MRELTCIVCPVGCSLEVSEDAVGGFPLRGTAARGGRFMPRRRCALQSVP
jgi:CxxC motif-containing protein